jgi:cytochrome c peroxidase
MKIKIAFFLGLILVYLVACTDDITPTIATYTPRPYLLESPEGFPPMPPNPSNPLTYEGIDLGRHLFYDPILSADTTISCASCHSLALAMTDGKPKSQGINGLLNARNAMPLFNLAWNTKFFWDGRASSIEEQALQPVPAHNEMNLRWVAAAARVQNSTIYKQKFAQAFPNKTIDSITITKAIAQFERTLLSYNSKFDKVRRGEDFYNDDELDGYLLMNDFFGGDCLHCHPTESSVFLSTFNFTNNGLDDAPTPNDYTDKGLGAVTGLASDNGKFKVPSLRNIALTAPYMHDGRFQTLDDVLAFYSTGVHQGANVDPKMEFANVGGVSLTADEKIKIKAFLNTLTDYTFINNPDYSSPF